MHKKIKLNTLQMLILIVKKSKLIYLVNIPGLIVHNSLVHVNPPLKQLFFG